MEVIRLLLAYGADPLLVTYAGQTPQELADGAAEMLLRLHIADIQGQAVEPWRFPSLTEVIGKFYLIFGFRWLCYNTNTNKETHRLFYSINGNVINAGICKPSELFENQI